VTDVTESFSLMVPINYQGKYTRLKQQEAVEVQVTIAAVPPPAAQKSGKASSKVGK
jgi:hypothetical protein